MEKQALNRWIMIAIGFVIELVLGSLYSWSVFVLPLEQEFGWVRSQTSLAFTVSLVFFPLGMIVGGRLTDKHGIRTTGSIGSVVLTAGLCLTSFTGSIPWLVVSYGVVAGFAIGFVANTVSNVLSWFPDKRGLATGALLMGFGLAALVLGSATNLVIVALGWRTAFRALAAFSLVVCLGGFQFLRKAPPGWQPSGWTPPAPNKRTPAPTLGDYAPAEMVSSGTFWMLELWNFLISTAGFMVIGHIVPMAVELGIAQTAAVVAMGTLSVANGVGRLLYGALSDRLGRAPTMFLGALLMSLAVFLTLPLTHSLGFAGLTVAVLFVGSSFGGGMSQITAMTIQFFGSKHCGTNLGLASSQIAISGILGPQLAALLRTGTGSYNTAFSITGALALAACLVAALFGLKLRRIAAAAQIKPSQTANY